MPSFESFQRQESEKLNYDDTAFLYYAFAMLICGLIPGTYYALVKPIRDVQIADGPDMRNCQCKLCVTRLTERKATYKYSFLTRSYLLRAITLAVLWTVCITCYLEVKDNQDLKSFLPHEILGLDLTAEVADVKRAYRRLSREKHPDKNPDNPAAVNEFI